MSKGRTSLALVSTLYLLSLVLAIPSTEYIYPMGEIGTDITVQNANTVNSSGNVEVQGSLNSIKYNYNGTLLAKVYDSYVEVYKKGCLSNFCI
jgi:hypothetical protein